MSLVSQIAALATRIATEVNSLRSEMSSLGGGASVTDTAPASPSTGSQWFNSATGQLFVYYDSYWVEVVSNTEVQALPIANVTGLQTELDAKAPIASPTFTGTATADSFSGSGTGLTGTAAGLEAGALGAGDNITTYVNGTLIPANTDTKIARLMYPDGMYAIQIAWSGGYNSSGGTIYWNSSYAGVTGIASASGGGYYHLSPAQQLLVTGTQHHRTVNAPTFFMGPADLTGNYGYLTLFINVPQATSFGNFKVIVKQLNRS